MIDSNFNNKNNENKKIISTIDFDPVIAKEIYEKKKKGEQTLGRFVSGCGFYNVDIIYWEEIEKKENSDYHIIARVTPKTNNASGIMTDGKECECGVEQDICKKERIVVIDLNGNVKFVDYKEENSRNTFDKIMIEFVSINTDDPEYMIDCYKTGDILIDGNGNPFLYNGRVCGKYFGAYHGIPTEATCHFASKSMSGEYMNYFAVNKWTMIIKRPANANERMILIKKMYDIKDGQFTTTSETQYKEFHEILHSIKEKYKEDMSRNIMIEKNYEEQKLTDDHKRNGIIISRIDFDPLLAKDIFMKKRAGKNTIGEIISECGLYDIDIVYWDKDGRKSLSKYESDYNIIARTSLRKNICIPRENIEFHIPYVYYKDESTSEDGSLQISDRSKSNSTGKEINCSNCTITMDMKGNVHFYLSNNPSGTSCNSGKNNDFLGFNKVLLEYISVNTHDPEWMLECYNEGEVLIDENGNPFIYKGKTNEGYFSAYCGITGDDNKCLVIGNIGDTTYSLRNWTSIIKRPATEKEIDVLLEKMRNIDGNLLNTFTEEQRNEFYAVLNGLEFYYKGRNMRVSKSGSDISYYTPEPFDKVLVRMDNDISTWKTDLFSNMSDEGKYICSSGYVGWDFCIPYEGNENLVGTTRRIQ